MIMVHSHCRSRTTEMALAVKPCKQCPNLFFGDSVLPTASLIRSATTLNPRNLLARIPCVVLSHVSVPARLAHLIVPVRLLRVLVEVRIRLFLVTSSANLHNRSFRGRGARSRAGSSRLMRPAPYPYILSTCPWNRTTHLLVISEAYSPIYLAGMSVAG